MKVVHAVECGEPFVGCWERERARGVGVDGIEKSERGTEFHEDPAGFARYVEDGFHPCFSRWIEVGEGELDRSY